MKKTCLLIVATLALAFTVPTPAQTFTPPVTATSAQVTAQIAALGIALPSDQTVATISRVSIRVSATATLAEPVFVRITFAPSTSGVVEQESYPVTTAQITAALAAGPTLSESSPSSVTIFNRAGVFSEMAR